MSKGDYVQKILNITIAFFAVLMIGVMLLADPVKINERVNKLFGWQPQLPMDVRLVPKKEAEAIRAIAGGVSQSQIEQEIRRFAGFGSRVPGYGGDQRAFEYVKKRFQDLGLEDVKTESFEVTVPGDRGGQLQIGRQTVKVHALWPNGVRSSTLPAGGVSGSLIYGGKGELEELDGLPVEGSIVLLDFDCGQNYLNVASLGALAILFFDNGLVSREQAADKFVKVPVNVPRFWLERTDAEFALETLRFGPVNAKLTGRMDWDSIEAHNVLGWIRGSDELLPEQSREHSQAWKEQVLVIESYYDAISVVPAIAPGAENATGIVALLQLAELLKKRPPNYSVLFLATSGHFEGLAGINDFLYRHSRRSDYFRERMPDSDRIDFDLMLSLDLSSHSRRTISFGMGTFYAPKWKTDNYVKFMLTPYSARLTLAVEEIFNDTTRHVEGVSPQKRTWKNFMPVRLAFDSESAAFVGQKALALAAANDSRHRVDTPMDTPEHVDFTNLARQIETLGGLVLWATRDADLLKPTKLELEDYGHSLSGSVYWFDRDVNFAVPKKPVPHALVTYQQLGPNSVAGVRTLIVDRSDSQGRFRFDIMRNKLDNTIKAYEIGPRGEILSAPDMGQEGDETYPMEHPWGWWENEMLQVVFKCRALSLFETVDSQYLSVLDHLTVLNDRDGEPQSWGADFVEDQSAEEGKVTLAATVYAEPGDRVKTLMSTSLFGVRYLLSGAPEGWVREPVNAQEVDAEIVERAYGTGYAIDDGVVLRPAYAAAKDMWVLDDVRIKQLARYGVRNEKFMRLHEEARLSLLQAQDHLEAREYSDFKAATRRAWGLEARGYPDVKSTADDTVYGVIFYFALLLPFSFFCERLMFSFPDVRRQLLGACGFFIGIFLMMRYIHPAFKLSSSPYIIFLAFVIFAIGITALVMVLGRFTQSVKERKRAASGMHEADIGRLSATAAAINLGISNLRKRPIRTLLTVATLTLLTFTAQAFTSVQPYLKFYQIPRDTVPGYEGALLRDPGWKGMQLSVLDYARSAFGDDAEVRPRSWLISKNVGERAYIDIERESKDHSRRYSSFGYAVLGLTPGEVEVLAIDRYLVGERSRWFQDGDYDVCILPQAMAEILNIRHSDVGGVTVELMGETYLVVGIFDGDAVDHLRDLDGESLMPVDTVAEAKKMEQMEDLDPRMRESAAIESFAHLPAANVILLPHEKVVDLGGTLRSLALARFTDVDTMVERVEEFVTRVAVPIFVGSNGKVHVYTSMGSASISGLSNLFIPLLIAALIVLNTMMGAVYERDREIGVYSSVGLAPSHISALFIAEAVVFAVIGAVLGYLLGQSVTLLMTRLEILGGMFLNYSSLSAIASTAIVMATVVLSTLYPARKAADMSVPDVTRRWKFPEPNGDDWNFDFPFTIGNTDALGISAYLHRIFSSYGEGSVGDFMTEDVNLNVTLDADGEEVYSLDLMAWLAPYDLGVSQQVALRSLPSEISGVYRIEIEIHRVSGDVASWKRLNSGFLNVLRKRFLVWRTISGHLREEYLKEGRLLSDRSFNVSAV